MISYAGCPNNSFAVDSFFRWLLSDPVLKLGQSDLQQSLFPIFGVPTFNMPGYAFRHFWAEAGSGFYNPDFDGDFRFDVLWCSNKFRK